MCGGHSDPHPSGIPRAVEFPRGVELPEEWDSQEKGTPRGVELAGGRTSLGGELSEKWNSQETKLFFAGPQKFILADGVHCCACAFACARVRARSPPPPPSSSFDYAVFCYQNFQTPPSLPPLVTIVIKSVQNFISNKGMVHQEVSKSSLKASTLKNLALIQHHPVQRQNLHIMSYIR